MPIFNRSSGPIREYELASLPAIYCGITTTWPTLKRLSFEKATSRISKLDEPPRKLAPFSPDSHLPRSKWSHCPICSDSINAGASQNGQTHAPSARLPEFTELTIAAMATTRDVKNVPVFMANVLNSRFQTSTGAVDILLNKVLFDGQNILRTLPSQSFCRSKPP